MTLPSDKKKTRKSLGGYRSGSVESASGATRNVEEDGEACRPLMSSLCSAGRGMWLSEAEGWSHDGGADK